MFRIFKKRKNKEEMIDISDQLKAVGFGLGYKGQILVPKSVYDNHRKTVEGLRAKDNQSGFHN